MGEMLLQDKHLKKEQKVNKFYDPTLNTYTVLEGQLALRAMGDRIIVLEDKFRTGYECKECEGLGYAENVLCATCKGERIEKAVREDLEDRACTQCTQSGYPTGRQRCSACNGKGALVIVPQTSERRTTSGKVYSVGPDCSLFKLGDHVLYGSYAGTAVTLKNRYTIRILHEDEIIAQVYATTGFNYSEVAL
jgi:co-chaperonin GroES (HSP10)